MKTEVNFDLAGKTSEVGSLLNRLGSKSTRVFTVSSRTVVGSAVDPRASSTKFVVRTRNSAAVPHSWHPNCRGQIDPVADD